MIGLEPYALNVWPSYVKNHSTLGRPLVTEIVFDRSKFEISKLKNVHTFNLVKIRRKNDSANQNAAWGFLKSLPVDFLLKF